MPTGARRGRALVLTILPFLSGTYARAFFVTPSVKQTLGSGQYVGTSGYVEFGGDWTVKPAYSSYHSSASSGTFRTYSLRLGYGRDGYGFGITGGWTPIVNGYNNHFLGGDVSVTVVPGSDGPVLKGSGKENKDRTTPRLDLDVGLTQTIHTDRFQRTIDVNGRPVVSPRAAPLDMDETDLDLSMGLTLKDIYCNMTALKAVYDRDLAKLSARSAQATRLSGLVSTIQGFPDFSSTLKTELRMAPVVTPYLSYTYTKFKVTQPNSAAYTVGAYWDGDWINLDASYQRYAQKGASDINYYSLGATLSF